ncbi:MAG: hydroxymethylglutaryl-CoA reductase [Chloroflexi bacterium]|nr:hydroxymethylglutaryl-CoA reductase [Chloroflexota bacterium]
MSSDQRPATSDQLPKLRDVAVGDRLPLLARLAALTDADIEALRQGLSLEQADHMIENVVATYALPFAVATNFVVNGRVVLVPMVVEESSVVAACSFAAKLARAGGGFTAGSSEPVMIGQIQLLDVPDLAQASQRVQQSADELVTWLNTQNPATMSKHARAVGIEIRELEMRDSDFAQYAGPSQYVGVQSPISNLQSPISPMLIVHVLYDCGDAMGANLVNTACEALAPRLEVLTGGRANLRILSNLSDRRLAWARCVIPKQALDETLDTHDAIQNPKSQILTGLSVQNRIVEASVFAELDPYRAATHNKGVMNGVDAVVIATGNDWRAIEAGAHAYAARSGRYTALTRWRQNAQGDLMGEIELPMAVGTVGGATRVHPTAQVALKILAVYSARELAEIIACVGLAQNFAAIRALAAEGIQRGHMSLHARQIALAAGATGERVDQIAEQLVREGNIRLERAKQILGNEGMES